MFLPTTAQELKTLGWVRPDVILVTGDAYIDSPNMGVSLIGQVLMKQGFRTAVIAQPSTVTGDDIERLGEPALFWGVTAGAIDSMVANYTAVKKFRRHDDYTPGGVNIRPNRATICYTNLIRQHFKQTKPIILGGIEASLRRIAHYDYWDDVIRRSLLFDAKADILAYGMAEKTVIHLARTLKEGNDWRHIPGICYISAKPEDRYITIPSFEEVSIDKETYRLMSRMFHRYADDPTMGFVQGHGNRYLIHNPPFPPLSTDELDEISDISFERDVHPYYDTGEIRALTTIKQSVTTHRGCFGQCNFCSISVHQGRSVTSRSVRSIVDEVLRIKEKRGFNGIIYDIGGPTANMFGTSCLKGWSCKDRGCLTPKPCPNLGFGHQAQIELLRQIRSIDGIKKVFVSSGIRPDLVTADKEVGRRYIEELVRHHVSGQIKLAPEHSDADILSLMNKPSVISLMQFKSLFDKACERWGKPYFMTYYLIAAHPGCTTRHMQRLRDFLSSGLKTLPEQVQIFTPLPGTISSTMYYCETDITGKRLFCEKNPGGMQKQKDILKKSGKSRRK